MRTYQIQDEAPERDAEWRHGGIPTRVVTWNELVEANDPDTMEEISQLKVGESTILGQCDPITRLT